MDGAVMYCHGLSDPQREELVADHWNWRRFVGLSWHIVPLGQTTRKLARDETEGRSHRAGIEASGGDLILRKKIY
ncbi:MAG TPA: hypothetical protein VGH42_11955 [Verrucomicrobiae bacterium]